MNVISVGWATAIMKGLSFGYYHKGCYTAEKAASDQEKLASGYYTKLITRELAATDLASGTICSGCWQPLAK